MKFYLGVHHPCLAKHFDRCFVSVNVLRDRKSDFQVKEWIMDSGAFTEISQHGGYRSDVVDYARQINRWATCGNMELAVSQDYMCEPFILSKTGLTIADHQRLTIERYDTLLELTSVPVMPVLQGYAPEEYVNHLDEYGDRLLYGQRVGVGSICKRNSNPTAIVAVLEAIKRERPDLRLHGFGLKTTALQNAYILYMLYSADSMAWSYAARREGRNANSQYEAASFLYRITTTQGCRPHQLTYLEAQR